MAASGQQSFGNNAIRSARVLDDDEIGSYSRHPHHNKARSKHETIRK
jgi:hypothetical protein